MERMESTMKHGIFLAVLAAGLYALSSPFSKLLLQFMPSTLMAGFLYLGAGLGMTALAFGRKAVGRPEAEARLTRKELPYTIAMIVLDIAAPISLLFGLTMTTAANASLLNNFEIVATAIIALLIFKESISARLWLGILFVTASCALLSFEDISSLQFNLGSLFVLLACILWGIENNCTRKLSSKDPLEIVMVKGIFSGLGSVVIGLVCALNGEIVEGSAGSASFTCGPFHWSCCLALSHMGSVSIFMSMPRDCSALPGQAPTMRSLLSLALSCHLSSFAKSPESCSSPLWRLWPSARGFLPATELP